MRRDRKYVYIFAWKRMGIEQRLCGGNITIMELYRKTTAILYACILPIFVGCQSSQPPHWSYTGYDSTGARVVTGWIELTPSPGDTLAGAWELEPVGSAEHLGPQIGSGSYTGHQEGMTVDINLNPDRIDDNVILRGNIVGDAMKGTWEYIGFVGRINHGTFRALR
ncbi:MAG: hypothetical protein D6762_06960 [Candidatus Neomarinimicrobiota bacterium]|nr:MAG: hypothetical protein D6762_06960 [Candidatus Neomarinimicrobiota bacterium]